MINSGLLEAAIGLVLIYMILSFLSTGINEWIATLSERRAQFLQDGIERLLGADLSQTLYKHPLVAALGRKTGRGDRRPSYLPGPTFAKVVTAIIGSQHPGADMEQMINDVDNLQVRDALLTLWKDAGSEIGKFKVAIEGWFDDTMDRVSGWYKRRTQLVTFVVAVGIAVTLNADSIRIATTLWTNPTLRSALVVQAEQAVQQQKPTGSESSPPTAPPTIQQSLNQVQSLPLPLGWTSADDQQDPRALPDSFLEVLIKILGLLITACALTVGAPFWFDLLQRFVNIRAAGKVPSPEDAKKP